MLLKNRLRKLQEDRAAYNELLSNSFDNREQQYEFMNLFHEIYNDYYKDLLPNNSGKSRYKILKTSLTNVNDKNTFGKTKTSYILLIKDDTNEVVKKIIEVFNLEQIGIKQYAIPNDKEPQVRNRFKSGNIVSSIAEIISQKDNINKGTIYLIISSDPYAISHATTDAPNIGSGHCITLNKGNILNNNAYFTMTGIMSGQLVCYAYVANSESEIPLDRSKEEDDNNIRKPVGMMLINPWRPADLNSDNIKDHIPIKPLLTAYAYYGKYDDQYGQILLQILNQYLNKTYNETLSEHKDDVMFYNTHIIKHKDGKRLPSYYQDIIGDREGNKNDLLFNPEGYGRDESKFKKINPDITLSDLRDLISHEITPEMYKQCLDNDIVSINKIRDIKDNELSVDEYVKMNNVLQNYHISAFDMGEIKQELKDDTNLSLDIYLQFLKDSTEFISPTNVNLLINNKIDANAFNNFFQETNCTDPLIIINCLTSGMTADEFLEYAVISEDNSIDYSILKGKINPILFNKYITADHNLTAEDVLELNTNKISPTKLNKFIKVMPFRSANLIQQIINISKSNIEPEDLIEYYNVNPHGSNYNLLINNNISPELYRDYFKLNKKLRVADVIYFNKNKVTPKMIEKYLNKTKANSFSVNDIDLIKNS